MHAQSTRAASTPTPSKPVAGGQRSPGKAALRGMSYDEGAATLAPGDPKPDYNRSEPLRKGSSGASVMSAQRALNQWIARDGRKQGYQDNTLATDGKYGANTEYVVARFQQCNGLGSSGVVNGASMEALAAYGFVPELQTVESKGGGV